MGTRAVSVTIEGTSALLMHAFPLAAIEALEKQSLEKQAEYAAYRDPEGVLFIPAVNVQRALVAAAAYSKGKGRASLQKSAAACLMVSPERLSLNTKTYIVDSRPVVVPATKGRVLRHRPRLDHWKISFQLDWDDTLLTLAQVRRIIDDMGQRVGLLDFRPEKKGPFGRCMVVNWKESA